MALQTKSISANGSKGHHKFTLTVTENSTSTSGNTSSVSWKLVLSPVSNGYNWEYSATIPVTYSININGSTYSGNIMNYDGYSSVTVRSGTNTIEHNADGSKSISYSFSVSSLDVYYLTGSASASGSMALTTIPRASSVSGGSGNIGETTTINISRASSSFTHTLEYAFGNLTGTIATGVGTSYNWTIPTSFYAQIPNSNSGTGSITCKTYNGSTLIGTKTTSFTAKVTNSNPTVGSLSYKDNNDFTVNITENNQRIIRENSNLLFTVGTATAKNSASISKYEIIFNERTLSRTSAGDLDFGKINLSSNTTATLKVTDSRGNTATKEITVIIDDWKLPTGLISLNRRNNFYSETYLKVDGTYSSLNGKNSMSIQYQYRKVTDKNFSELYNLEDNVQTTIDLDNNYQWHIIVIVGDRIGETTYNLSLDRGIPLIFFDRLNENVGINCFPNGEYKLDIDGNANGKNLPVATGINSLSDFDKVGAGEYLYKSGFYSVNVDNVWYNLINVRHRNGYTDGTNYGFQIRNKFAMGSDIEFRQQNNGTWGEWKSISGSSGGNSVLGLTITNKTYSLRSWSAIDITKDCAELFKNNDGIIFEDGKIKISPNATFKFIDIRLYMKWLIPWYSNLDIGNRGVYLYKNGTRIFQEFITCFHKEQSWYGDTYCWLVPVEPNDYITVAIVRGGNDTALETNIDHANIKVSSI